MMLARSVAAVSALLLASVANSEVPIPEDDHQFCAGMRVSYPSWSTPPLVPRSQGRLPLPEPATDLCSEYTKAGWVAP